MISLQVEDYCHRCPEFESENIKSTYIAGHEPSCIIKCRNRHKCGVIKRFLEEEKEEKKISISLPDPKLLEEAREALAKLSKKLTNDQCYGCKYNDNTGPSIMLKCKGCIRWSSVDLGQHTLLPDLYEVKESKL